MQNLVTVLTCLYFLIKQVVFVVVVCLDEALGTELTIHLAECLPVHFNIQGRLSMCTTMRFLPQRTGMVFKK